MVKRFISNLKGHNTNASVVRDLQKLESKLRDVYNSAEIKKPTENGGVKYSIKQTRNVSFEKQLEQIEHKKMSRSDSLYIRPASNDLINAGISNMPFAMNQSDYNKSRREIGNNRHYSSHGVPYEFFQSLPNRINTAAMLIDNGDKVTIITDYHMQDKKGEPSFVIVGVALDQSMESDTVNQIKSVYPWDNISESIVKAAEVGRFVVINRNKAEKQLATIGITPSEVSRVLNLAKDSITETHAKSQEKVSERDSNGNSLSKGQQEYFKNSVVRDEGGKLLLVYHGTRKADFTVFKRNLNYYTDSEAVADSYAPNSEKFTGYLKIEKPFVIDAHGDKWSGIIIDDELKEKLQEYGSSVFKENGKWKTSVADIASAIADMVDEGEADCDGIIIKNVDDTGSYYKGEQKNVANDYITFTSNQFKNRDNQNPTSNPDIRFSLRGGRLDELRYRPEMFAKWLLRKNGSNADVATVTEMIKKIIATDNKGGKTRDINDEIKKLETSK